MAIRYYVMPMAHGTDPRGHDYIFPKYIPAGVQYGLVNYGRMDWCIVAADVTTAQHNTIAANSDVLSVPANIENTLTAGAVTTAQTFLNSVDIPAGWITTGMTYHYVLKIIAAFFQYIQRVRGLLGRDFNMNPGWPSLQIQQVPLDIRNAMIAASESFEYDYSWVTNTTTLAEILKSMADNWGDVPIYLNVGTL